jgi:uncharacterized protein (UPF0332 family)
VGKQMNHDFQKGIEKKRIEAFPQAKGLVKDEIRASEDDFQEAGDRLINKKYKYVTITAYYAMFHAGRALVYSKGYREKSHYYLLVALRALFVEQGLLPEKLITEFHDAMTLREDADYHAQFSKEGAESVLASAKKLLSLAKSLVGNDKK